MNVLPWGLWLLPIPAVTVTAGILFFREIRAVYLAWRDGGLETDDEGDDDD